MSNDPDDRPWRRTSDRDPDDNRDVPYRSDEREDRYDEPPYRGGGDYRDRPHYEQPHRGVLILVLGIIGIVTCPITGVFAWFMGGGDLRKMDAGQMDPQGKGLTQAGRIMGLISMIIMILYVVMFIGMFMFMFAVGAAAPAPAPAPVRAPNNQFNQPAPAPKGQW